MPRQRKTALEGDFFSPSVPPPQPRNVLYYGENLRILRESVQNESVDLIYLDPPFKSSQEYNILFREQDGSRAAAQLKAFDDTWRWDRVTAAT
jgi:site-specific DNA-methyltransferase (adenine-specific)